MEVIFRVLGRALLLAWWFLIWWSVIDGTFRWRMLAWSIPGILFLLLANAARRRWENASPEELLRRHQEKRRRRTKRSR